MNPMTDVPVTAAWTLVRCSRCSTGHSWPVSRWPSRSRSTEPRLAGRGCRLLDRADRLARWRSGGQMPARTIRLAIGVAPAVIGLPVQPVSVRLGARVGIRRPRVTYALSHVSKNVSQFTTWLFESQTPIVIASLVFFVAPQWIDATRVTCPRVLLGGVMLAVLLSYLFYLPFDAWTYLRFLLPMWPALMLSIAVALDAASRRWMSAHARALPQLLALACVALAVWRGVGIAVERGTFDFWRGERKYVDVGRYLSDHTDARAVILSFQHSGSIRLYGDRLTMRWDQLDVAWLDRAIEHSSRWGGTASSSMAMKHSSSARCSASKSAGPARLDTDRRTASTAAVLIFDAAIGRRGGRRS
jgi:hypothetical protein